MFTRTPDFGYSIASAKNTQTMDTQPCHTTIYQKLPRAANIFVFGRDLVRPSSTCFGVVSDVVVSAFNGMDQISRLAKSPHENVIGAVSIDDRERAIRTMPILFPQAQGDLNTVLRCGKWSIPEKLRYPHSRSSLYLGIVILLARWYRCCSDSTAEVAYVRTLLL